MSIKMIITDLDGTFYHRDLTYDTVRFNRLYKQMKQQNIQFVVASGNQYYQLISFFDQANEMSFIAENGGYVVDQNQELFSVEIDYDTWFTAANLLDSMSEVTFLLICGKKSSYVLASTPDDLCDFYRDYFPHLDKVNRFEEIDDQIMKVAIACIPEATYEIAQTLKNRVHQNLSVVTSGHGYIDIIVSGVHKGNAIEMLMKKYNVKPSEILAFGDAMNDLEMLQLAKYGFVMKNGDPDLKEKIGRVTPLDFEEDGELALIEEYFKDSETFLKKYE